jgi:pyrroline-5-carboxylate reductase
MAQHNYNLGVIGAGKMGRALIKALVEREVLTPEGIIAADPDPRARDALHEACPGVATVADACEPAAAAEVLLIAVKPQSFEDALEPTIDVRPPDQLVVSIMAGAPIARIAALFGEQTAIIRVMPNVLCEVAEGAFGYAANDRASPAQTSLVAGWLNSIGAAEELEEKLLDAVTGLSGSGPAFVAMFIEALADGGVTAGLSRAVAQRLAAQTVLGAGKWVRDNAGPAALKDTVCSPGGTTAAGVRALEAGGLRSAAIEAVMAAAGRARELGQ